MEAEKNPGPVERERTLLERIEGLETHHEETRKRLHSLEERFQHQRDRIDRILGSEPEAAEPDFNPHRYDRLGR
jgi:hypothetical protein